MAGGQRVLPETAAPPFGKEIRPTLSMQGCQGDSFHAEESLFICRCCSAGPVPVFNNQGGRCEKESFGSSSACHGNRRPERGGEDPGGCVEGERSDYRGGLPGGNQVETGQLYARQRQGVHLYLVRREVPAHGRWALAGT